MPVRVLAVIVLYKMLPNDSASFRTLRTAMLRLQGDQKDIKVVLYDNTPCGQDASELPIGVHYKADYENGGLAKAYNYALEIAYEEGYDWLLTLDQDSNLPLDFLCRLCNTARFAASLGNVAAIVPFVHSDGRVISPVRRMKHFPKTAQFPDGFVGISLVKTIAVNSASTIKVSALRAIGGYDPRFYLDQSDIVLYHRLHCNNFSVFVAGNIHVEHELSIFDLNNRSTLNRYEDALRAEEAFYDEYMGWAEGVVLLLRILHLLIYRLRRTGGGLAYFKVGLRFLFRRLFYSRKHRVNEWTRSTKRG
jgi:GT2 family glycosyltransferase